MRKRFVPLLLAAVLVLGTVTVARAADPVGIENDTGLPVYESTRADDGNPDYYVIRDGSTWNVKGTKDGLIPGTQTQVYRYDVTWNDGVDRYYVLGEWNRRIPYDKVLPTFTDVSEGDWFYNAVISMADNGIISGDGDGTFRPNDPITIGEMATLVCRIDSTIELDDFYAHETNGGTSPNYGERLWDAPTSWAHNYIMSLGWNGRNRYPHWDPEAYEEPVMRGEAMAVAVEFARKMQKYCEIEWQQSPGVGLTWHVRAMTDAVKVHPGDSVEYAVNIPDFYPSAYALMADGINRVATGVYSNGTLKGARHGWASETRHDLELHGFAGWEYLLACDCSEYDINEHAWDPGAITMAYQLGIVRGIDERGTSGAHDPITRAEFCQMLYNMGITDKTTVGLYHITYPEDMQPGRELGTVVLERSKSTPAVTWNY